MEICAEAALGATGLPPYNKVEMIEQIENAIRIQLENQNLGLQIESFPLTQEYKCKAAKGAILVGYLGSQFDHSNYELGANALVGLNSIPENRKMDFEIRLYLRQLKNHQDLYAYLQQILEALTGFCPAGAGELLPLMEKVSGQTDGVWQSSLTFRTHYP